LLRAFRRDFEVNGPSVMRMMRTLMNGWIKYKNHPEKRIRKRFAKEVEKMVPLNAGALWATRYWFKDKPIILEQMSAILKDIYNEFGFKARLSAPIVGTIALYLLRKEEKRLSANHTYEPPTFYETHAKAVRPKKQLVRRKEAGSLPFIPAPAASDSIGLRAACSDIAGRNVRS